MSVSYNSKKLIPAPPAISINEVFQTTRDGIKIGHLYQITVNGTIVAYKGSPDSTGTFWTSSGYPSDESLTNDLRLKAIIKKQDALRELFATDGQWFEIQPLDGSAPLKFLPRITSLAFAPGIWFQRCDYTLNMECDVLYVDGLPAVEDSFSDKISDGTESWTIELGDQSESPESPQSFRLTHSVSAVGKSFYDNTDSLEMPAWQQARNWVLDRVGIDASKITSADILNVPAYYQGYNHVRSEQLGENDGAYSVTESWILTSGNAIEDFTVNTNASLQDGLTRVSLQGTVNGLVTRDSNYQIATTKWTAASGKFATVQSQFFNRAQTYGGVSLNLTPSVTQIGRNPLQGVITYTYEYDNRPTPCVVGARSEIITITDNNSTDIFASVPILGRAAGPVLQAINTISSPQRQLSVELIMDASGTCSTLQAAFQNKPNIQSIINAATGSLTYTQIFKDGDNETWMPQGGRYTRQLSWTYQ